MKVLIFTALISLSLTGCTDQKSGTSDAAKEVNFTELAFAASDVSDFWSVHPMSVRDIMAVIISTFI